ncbi:hypothetical protein E4N62_45405 [Streptomyces sp. MNU76]|uniref:hypothetical protein n=1 Tax=Streptomyces sp. MNU76 TaxID=2560026 RepID=UPI001E526DB8|nr:hypothetical protein [Streptomyces sp. MNU76]MCC9711823.1 hypothetical protein [Streptomyces sp. MNU76]
MDAHQVANSHDAFDTLLDASSLGAPRVQAVRRRTPASVRDLLASRRARPAADAQARPALLPERVTEDAPPPLPRAVEELEPPHAPHGNRSYNRTQIKSYFGAASEPFSSVPHSILQEDGLHQLNSLVRDCVDSAETAARAIVRKFPGYLEEVLKATEAPMETRLFGQLFFRGQDGSRIGRYGMGLKSSLLSSFICEVWISGISSGGLLGNGRSEHTYGNRRMRAGWSHAYRHHVPSPVWASRDTDAAQHVAAAVFNAVRPGDIGHWLVLGPCASAPSTHGMSTQAGHRACATRHLLNTVTTQRTQRSDPWCPPERIDAEAGLRDWLAAVGLSRGSRGSGRSFRGQMTNRGNGSHTWLCCSLTVYGPGVSTRSPAVPQTTWEQLVYGLLEWSAPVPHGCLTARHFWRGRDALLEERQTPGATGAAANQVDGFGGRCPAHPYRPLGRTMVSMNSRPDDRLRIPALASEFVMATRAAELLYTGLSETCREQVMPLSLALDLLPPAVGGRDSASRACRIEAAQEAATVWETARLLLRAENYRIAAPMALTSHRSDTYAVYAASEGAAGEQTVWTFNHDLLGAWLRQNSSDPSNARAGAVDRQSGDQVDACMDTRVNTAAGEGVLQLKQPDLARLPDSTRENTDNQHELPRMPSTLFTEWLSDAHRH